MNTIGEISELTGVTVRALHHYDEVGLLRPTGRSEAGYRLYSGADLERLREILAWRGLGFGLEEIKTVLDEPDEGRATMLRERKTVVDGEQDRLATVAAGLDAAIADAEYGHEARERWGHTDAYRQSRARAREYGLEQWRQIGAASEAIEEEMASLLDAGELAEGDAARAVARRHREHIATWFYDCSAQMHRGLGEMYIADERFAAHYEGRRAGLAAYMRDAISAAADEDLAPERQASIGM